MKGSDCMSERLIKYEEQHDFAYLAMNYMGMDEEEAYAFAEEMLDFIKNLVFQYAKEMGLLIDG